ncbi:MAG: hypothetical protein KJ040_06585 [Gammaproteobacteria bacterium]|nr:hypothetical protein [Gammaproteobacteria bacterium]
MTAQSSFDPPHLYSGGWEDYAVLGVMLAASVLAQLFLVERNRHPDNVHSPRLAWMRALLYFSVVLVISWATGVLQVLAHAPVVAPENLGSGSWLALTGIWLLVLVWAYVYWWPRGTLTHDRKLYLLPQIVFGLAWGFTSGQLTLVFWAVIEEFGFARWGTALLVFFVLAGYGQIYQSGWWDIHVSPPHNIRATNARKVLFGHMPFLCVALAHFTLFGNALLFVVFHGAALACSAVAMRFPPFWEKDGPVVSRETALGV